MVTIKVSVRSKDLIKRRQPKYIIEYPSKTGRKFRENFGVTAISSPNSLFDFIARVLGTHNKFKIDKERFAFASLKSKEIVPKILKLKNSESKSFKLI